LRGKRKSDVARLDPLMVPKSQFYLNPFSLEERGRGEGERIS